MPILKEIGYSYNDLTIVPANVSRVNSRKDVNPFYEDNLLPIFASPMSTVVNEKNFYLFEKNNIIPILPRNISIDTRLYYITNGKWVALSLNEFNEYIINGYENFKDKNIKVLIDVANGHMQQLATISRLAKNMYGNKLELMVGNIANPETYTLICESGVDYVRCSIGSGSCCTTTSNVAIHYPIGSLINDINDIKYDRKKSGLFCTKVVADGGIRNFSDVNKSLALGADYVMIGGLFGSFIEACGKITKGENIITEAQLKYWYNESDYTSINKKLQEADLTFDDVIIIVDGCGGGNFDLIKDGFTRVTGYCRNADKYNFYKIISIYNENLDESIKRELIENNFYRESYGMSTKKAQSLIKKSSELKTAEGIEKLVKINYTIKQWRDNMEAYLRSVMSYCNSFTLDEFIGKQKLIINTPPTIYSVNK